MSKSRLEKFLYALYSLDSSDLPTPLSRIEELYKCLVTGDEAPTFEPLSRVEKYLMAILGVYDADELPNPISRVEVLLYKLATGDDNLDDFKSFLSEHEELLAEIIRNGGVGGDIDIEYVLYTLSTEFNTLYNTAKKPVESAILKGKTINNLWTKSPEGVTVQEKTDNTTIEPYSEQYAKITFGETQVNAATIVGVGTTQRLQANKTYYINTFIFDAFDVTDVFLIRDNSNNINLDTFKIKGYPPGQILSFTTQAETDKLKFYYFAYTRKNGAINYGKPFYMPKRFIISDKLEDVVNQDFFEGMQSVKMPVLTTTGKNLYDTNKLVEDEDKCGYKFPLSKFKVGEEIVISVKEPKWIKISTYSSGASMHQSSDVTKLTFTMTENLKDNYIMVNNNNFTSINDIEWLKNNVQVEYGTSVTPYEPYKSNILTVNEEVELRGIGDVKDELNLLTGEVTKRVDTKKLKDIAYAFQDDQESETTYLISLGNASHYIGGGVGSEILSNITTASNIYYACETEGIRYDGWGLYLRIKKDRITEKSYNAVKQYFESTDATIQYQIKTESIKTVDLSVVDQDGNDTELSTFNDITHVTLSSEGLISEAELEVATKNEEVLNTMSLEMDDISTYQTTLEETSNTQSENVDATMLATTEIYEQLL